MSVVLRFSVIVLMFIIMNSFSVHIPVHCVSIVSLHCTVSSVVSFLLLFVWFSRCKSFSKVIFRNAYISSFTVPYVLFGFIGFSGSLVQIQ